MEDLRDPSIRPSRLEAGQKKVFPDSVSAFAGLTALLLDLPAEPSNPLVQIRERSFQHLAMPWIAT